MTLSWHEEVVSVLRVARGGEVRSGHELPSLPGLEPATTLVSRTRRDAFVHVPLGATVYRGDGSGGVEVPLGRSDSRPPRVVITPGERVRLSLCDGAVELVVEVGGYVAKPVAALPTFSSYLPSPLVAGVLLLYGLSVLGIVHALSSLGSTPAEPISREDILLMRKLLDAHAEREREREADEPTPIVPSDEPGTRGTKASQGASSPSKGGRLGATLPRKGEGVSSVVREASARRTEISLAGEFGMVGLLASGSASDPRASFSEWARAETNGMAESSAMFGAETWGQGGELFGLRPSAGEGFGGGGSGAGISLGRIGTFGRESSGMGFGCGCGLGALHDRGHHARYGMRFSDESLHVNGRLPPEAVQRVIRANAGRYRACYENGLALDPGLAGRVTVKFVIDRSGSVSVAQDGGSDLQGTKGQGVVSCVVRAFAGLSFPAPEGGIVTVVYPLVFSRE